jgi:hypothetical protein
MSEIPFVNALGDELERAIAARRRRVRRRVGIAALGFALLATGVAAASGVFTGTPEELATTSVGCYEGGGVTVVSAGHRTPVEACRQIGLTGPLVACADGPQVVVVSGRSCERRGLQPIPAGYQAARARVVAFQRAVTALETSADCIPPGEFAERVQRLLDEGGWPGWRTEVRSDLATGPCGTVTTMGGDGSRHLEASLDPREKRVLILPVPPRALTDLLYGPDGIAAPTMDATGERCYTVEGVQEVARRRLAAAGRPLTFAVGSMPADTGIAGSRGDRLNEGCAVIVGVGTTEEGAIRVEIWR